MPNYSQDQLNELPEFDDLEQALKVPEDVFRLSIHRYDTSTSLLRILDFSNLRSLSVSLTDVGQVLPRLPELPQLQNLSLQACDISVFPESILQLSHLRSLSIGNNSLRSLPDELTGLEQLEELRFSQNEIREIPQKIGRLTRLKTLGLSYNQLESIPASICDLAHLEWLFLDANNITEVPKAIGRLRSLISLSLNYNKLKTLPISIGELGNIEYLSIQHNPFVELPASLANLADIKSFSVEAEKRSMFMEWSYRHSKQPPQVDTSEIKLFVDAQSELYAPLVSAIEKHQLSSARNAILEVAREAIEVQSTLPDDYSQVGNSRLGGFPDLENSALYPTTDGLYWSFLAQINLSDIAPYNNFLPRSGLLSFFLDSTESLNGLVHFHSGDFGVLAPVLHGGGDKLYDPQDDYTQKPHRVRFQTFFSLPYGLPEGCIEDDITDAFSDCEDLHSSVDHHINGYTFTQHESPQQQAANKLGGKAEEWVPLLQLGWDSNVGFCFWDAGRLSFNIHREDLRRWDFSRVHVSLESS